MVTRRNTIALLTLALLMTACATSDMRRPAMVTMFDVTRSASMLQAQDTLILVTMLNDDHRRLTQSAMRIGKNNPLPPRYAKFVATMNQRYELNRVADWPLESLGIRCLVFAAPNSAARESIVAKLISEPMVETAQSMQFFETMADENSADGPSSTGQSDYNDPYLKMQHSFREMQITASHRFATGKGVSVAVIDTGVDTRHADLAQRVTGTMNFIDRSGTDFRNDIHGTAIAGVIAATANNDQGIVGVAPDASIIALKACKQLQPGNSKARCDSFALAKALDFALLENVDVINLSLAGPQDALLQRLVEKAIERDILVVGAADPNRPGEFPAYIDGVVAVSEAGAETTTAGNLIKAPGTKVISAFPKNRYEFFSGSSLATAQITGISALIKQRKPHLPSNAVQSLLTATSAADTGAANGCQALARVVSGASCP